MLTNMAYVDATVSNHNPLTALSDVGGRAAPLAS